MTGKVESRDDLGLAWLMRLRLAAVGGQAVAVIVTSDVLHVALPLAAVWTLIGIAAASNVYLLIKWQRNAPASERFLAGVLAFDVLVLTGLLFLTGGPFNPFSFLYLVYISLATVLLRARYTWALVGLSLICSALLFTGHLPLKMPAEANANSQHMNWHLWGMWVAFGVAAAYIVYAQIRVLSALARRDEELAAARHRAAQQERLASLATLAGGAAHELASPLSTIAVVAEEIQRQLETRDDNDDLIADMGVIRAQIDDCREILNQMAAQAGASAGEEVGRARVADLVDLAMSGLAEAPPVRLDLGQAGDAELAVTRRALAQALRVLLRNAQDASPPDEAVDVHVRRRDDGLAFEVRDRGTGMSPEVLARAGEPFFTTKQPGKGLGLGLFLCRAVIDSLGGRVDLDSQEGHGTTATIVIPTARVYLASVRAA